MVLSETANEVRWSQLPSFINLNLKSALLEIKVINRTSDHIFFLLCFTAAFKLY